MSQKFELLAQDRADMGKGASRRLRRTGRVPAILYGGHRDPRTLSLDHDALLHQAENEAFFSSILTVTVDAKSQPCVLKDLQRHPAKNQIMHVDLQRVLEDEEIRMLVPIHFLNEKQAVGVRREGAVITHIMNEVEVECLPGKLPEYLEVDVAELDVNEMIMLSELALPEGITIPELAYEGQDRPVVRCAHVKVVVEPTEEEEAAEEAEEVPTIAEEEAVEEDEDEERSKD